MPPMEGRHLAKEESVKSCYELYKFSRSNLCHFYRLFYICSFLASRISSLGFSFFPSPFIHTDAIARVNPESNLTVMKMFWIILMFSVIWVCGSTHNFAPIVA